MVASKLSQILQLTPPNEIVFQGPFEHVVTSYLELKNPLKDRVCFKVKTTAPRRYCVRPNSGIVEPDGKVKIAIMLQPMDPDTFAERIKHKFMVQSIVMEDSLTVSTDEIWQNAQPEQIMDSKLRCVFQSSDQAASNQQQQQEEQVSASGAGEQASPVNKKTDSSSPPSQQQQQQRMERQSKPVAGGINSSKLVEDPTSEQPITTSTLTSSSSSRVTSTWPSPEADSNRNAKRSSAYSHKQEAGDKSMASSSHNLTTSFLQPMSDDYKIVLVSLAMLFLGVILGKYII